MLVAFIGCLLYIGCLGDAISNLLLDLYANNLFFLSLLSISFFLLLLIEWLRGRKISM